jgi:hypothetical protein
MSKRISPIVAALALSIFAITVIATGSAPDASAAAGDGGWIDHPGLVPSTPETGYPIILDSPANNGLARQTREIDLIGNYIVSGGDFMTVELQNGTLVSQPYLAIFDWRTKDLVCTDLDVDDEIWAIAPGPDANTAIIGGRFNKVNGADGVERTRNKIATIDSFSAVTSVRSKV